ncbi:MAG: N-acetylglucosamine-6-phosphate deacetylase [Planctomycetaceae bacterium]|nr:N-acetylglucosamine-6-phosphate deacetylase [Planctomycetaceae bacterium]
MTPPRNRHPVHSRVLFTDCQIIGPDRIWQDHELLVHNGRIETIRPAGKKRPQDAQIVSLRGCFLTPGLIDIHVHGGGGTDFMDGTIEAVRTACQTHLRHGTTTLFPTTTTGTVPQLEAMLEVCAQVQAADFAEPSCLKKPATARIGGVHLYGPYFAPDKVGCHLPNHQRAPDKAEYDRYFKTGLIRIATCAAELPGAKEFYQTAKKYGCLVTCGHSNSTFTEMQAAFRQGMRHVDHFWCAMSSVTSLRPRCGTPMQAGMEQFVLIEPEMSTEVIADGCHLSDDLLRFAFHFKGPERLCLVTDSSRALDQPPGEYRFGSQVDGPHFYSDGQVGWTTDRKGLASSVAGMDRMIRTMYRATKAPLPSIIRMASLTPAERVGISRDYGSIEVGKVADLVIWTKRWQVKQVYLAGSLTW